jgi:hypothetical protein
MGLQALRIIASVLLAAGALLLCGALAHAYTADIEVGDITINEVMWGPVGNDNYREWFEVKNMAGRDLDLAACRRELILPKNAPLKRSFCPEFGLRAPLLPRKRTDLGTAFFTPTAC